MKICSILMVVILASIGAEGQARLELLGNFFGKNNIEAALVRDYYGEKPERMGADTIRNDRFRIVCPPGEIMPVTIAFHEGKMMSSYTIIAEPGKVEYIKDVNNRLEVRGGKYNQLLFGYQRSKAYRDADDTFRKLTNGGNIETVKGTPNEWPAIEAFLRRDELRSNYLHEIAQTNKDPRARVMAIVLNELQPDKDKSMEIVDKLASELGENSRLVQVARRKDKEQTAMIARRKEMMIGSTYTDFKAPSIEGDSVQFSPIVQQHKYTLLQFWASWCAPCRKEIPLLKKLYSAYHSKGLAIVSFSLDDNRTNWVKASGIEKLEWHNLSDLKAFKSFMLKQYPVAATGIPANVLIGQDGKIIAANLTGEDLEKKLASLFN